MVITPVLTTIAFNARLVERIKPMSIRLGNNTVQIVDRKIQLTTHVGNQSFTMSYQGSRLLYYHLGVNTTLD